MTGTTNTRTAHRPTHPNSGPTPVAVTDLKAGQVLQAIHNPFLSPLDFPDGFVLATDPSPPDGNRVTLTSTCGQTRILGRAATVCPTPAPHKETQQP